MNVTAKKRFARSRIQLWQLAGVAPTVVAALALPATAKAAVDRNAAQRADSVDQSCAPARADDLELIIELGCVPVMPVAAAGETAAPTAPGEFAAQRSPDSRATPAQSAAEAAGDAATRCEIWTSVPDLDADVAIPSYCIAPVQAVLAAPSVASPTLQLADPAAFDERTTADGFYAVENYYAVDGYPAVSGVHTLDGLEGTSSTLVSAADQPGDSDPAAVAGTFSASVPAETTAARRDVRMANRAATAIASRLDPPASGSPAPTFDRAPEALANRGDQLVEGWLTTVDSAAVDASTAPPMLMAGDATVQVDKEPTLAAAQSALTKHGSNESPRGDETAASETLSFAPAGRHCAANRDTDLDSAMPTYCTVAAQIIVDARSPGAARPDPSTDSLLDRVGLASTVAADRACTATSEDLADSAMALYCTAPMQIVTADRSQAVNVQPVNVQPMSALTPPALDGGLAPSVVPESLLGAKVVALDELSETRGGFEMNDRGQTLRVSFGIERTVFVNGALVSTSTLALDGLGRLTDVGSGAQGANVRSASSTANVVRTGPDNVMSLGAQGLPAGAFIVQNSLNNQRLDANTVVNAVVEASGLLRATRLEAAMREATTGALRR